MTKKPKPKPKPRPVPQLDDSVGLYLSASQWKQLLDIASVGTNHTGLFVEKFAGVEVINELRQQLAYATRAAPRRAKRG